MTQSRSSTPGRQARLGRIATSLCVGVLAWAAAARAAEPAAHAPKSADQGVLAAELAADGLWLRVCAEAACSARQGTRHDVPPEVKSARSKAVFELVSLEQARKLLHVRVPLEGGQWEALLAARPGRLEPLVLFEGRTGYAAGVDGERRGAAVQIVQRTQGQRVLVGELREDVNLCGRTTLLAPRLLTPARLELEPASAQRLGAEERRTATALRAERATPATLGGNPLRAVAASSSLGDPGAISDGDPATRWSEARAGAGRGEFVVLRAPADRPLSGFDVLVSGAGAGPRAAAPRDVWVATRGALYLVSWPENAAAHAGAWYRVQLPSAVYTDCVALVLERAYSDAETAEVGVAELVGRLAAPTIAPDVAAARLDTPGAEGEGALAALLDAGDAGIDATLKVFAAQGPVGRQRALEVLERAPCSRAASVYAGLLADPAQSERAERRLRQCGVASSDALVAAYDQSDAARRRALLPLLASITPAAGIPLFSEALPRTEGRERDAYRDAFSAAARRPESRRAVARLLADTTRAPRASLELLRLLGGDIVEHEPAAGAALARIVRASPIFAVRFLALEPAARLSSREPAALEFLRAALHDPDPHLRAEAARRVPPIDVLMPELASATRDPEVRVRAAASARLGELGSASVPSVRAEAVSAAPVSAEAASANAASAEAALSQRLADDRWPLVRATAASALAHVGTAPSTESLLVKALADAAPSVRRAALLGLGARGAISSAGAVAERFQDDDEAPSVRAAAAQTLAALCTHRWVDDLTRVALWLREPGRPEGQLDLARASLSALGHLAPTDLQQRLAPLREAKVSPLLRPAIEAALHDPERCEANASAPGHPTR